jgi:dTDP-3-amino-3,4,6-trideoxy-alpha-D-glucose transaminase
MDAIEIALRCAGLRPGDRVLTTPLSAFASTLAIVRCRGVPVFADTDENGLLDLGLCRRILEKRINISFLLPVHLYGFSVDLDALGELRDRFDLHVIEDCAQSVGASFGTVPIGTVGQVSATSFYPTKNLGALGDGGAVLTSNATMAELARALRNYGQTATYRHEVPGLNSRLDELHAAILADAMLPMLDNWNRQRRATAQRYSEGIRNPLIQLPSAPKRSAPVWHLYPILAPKGRRQDLAAHLRKHGVSSGVHYPTLIPDQPALTSVSSETIGELKNARRFAACELSLPIHPFLKPEEIDQVIAACNDWGRS